MATAGDEIVNPRTGQRMVFLEASGQSVRIDTHNPPTGVPEPEHVHPFQESGAQVISGSLKFRVSGEERSIKAGDSITIPAGTPHNFWNDGEKGTHSIQWFSPALKIDRFFESFFGLAQDGKLNEKGLPSLLQLAVMVPHFGNEIRLTSPPWAVQRALFGLLAPIGRMFGYRPEYPYPHGGNEGPMRTEDEQFSSVNFEVKIIGAGFGRTGTMSLKAALETLGFSPCYHMTEVFEHPEHADFWQAAWRGEPADWDAGLGGYKATVDWPACTFYAELLERNPDAKVILSVRDSERWYESTHNTIYELTKLSGRSLFSRVGLAFLSLLRFGTFTTRPWQIAEEIVLEGTFDGKFEDKQYAIEVFNQHNEEVQRHVLQERLLIYEVKEGWGPLCEFLDVKEPDKPFPRLNDAAELRRMIVVVRVLSVALPAALALLVIAALALLGSRARP